MANADDVGEVYRTYLHFGLGIKQYQILDFLKFDTWKEFLNEDDVVSIDCDVIWEENYE